MECLCSICGKIVRQPDLFCYSCYSKFRDDIIMKKPWAKFLQNEEHQRRRRTEITFISDVFYVADDGSLVLRDGWQKT